MVEYSDNMQCTPLNEHTHLSCTTLFLYNIGIGPLTTCR